MVNRNGPGFERRKAGPWAIVIVPIDATDDPVYPTRRAFLTMIDEGKIRSTLELTKAHQFTDLKEAKQHANRYMFRFKGNWAEPVSFPHLWAAVHGSTTPWPKMLSKMAKLLAANLKEVVPDV